MVETRAPGRTWWDAAAASGSSSIPRLRATFPRQLERVSLDTFYRAIHKVQPSLIRTDADEVIYNLHVMIHFDFELALREGKLAVKDLPEAWHARYQTDLGCKRPTIATA
jgi:carboxypeptidase Taq